MASTSLLSILALLCIVGLSQAGSSFSFVTDSHSFMFLFLAVPHSKRDWVERKAWKSVWRQGSSGGDDLNNQDNWRGENQRSSWQGNSGWNRDDDSVRGGEWRSSSSRSGWNRDDDTVRDGKWRSSSSRSGWNGNTGGSVWVGNTGGSGWNGNTGGSVWAGNAGGSGWNGNTVGSGWSEQPLSVRKSTFRKTVTRVEAVGVNQSE